MSNEERQWRERIEAKLDLLLSQKYGASQMPSDELQGLNKKAPAKRQGKVKHMDVKTLLRKRGII